MNIQETNRRLYESGMKHSMCKKIADAWNGVMSEQELIDMWYDNYDFALVHHFPDNDEIKACFSKEILRKNNVLVNDVWSILNPGKAMILGSSTTNIRFNSFNVGQVWVRDTSKANVYVKDYADVTICVMDKANVNIINYSQNAKVLVIIYSKTAQVTAIGTNITNKENLTYLQH